MALKFIDDQEFYSQISGKKVLCRFDFNVPLSKADGTITDTTRIDEAIPSIKFLLEKGASKVVMMSHLGRPDGEINPKYSLEPVAKYLAEKLGLEVIMTETCTDRGIKQMIDLPTSKLVLLQNLRYHKEEEANDRDFARLLSTYGDFYVNDAFGTAHRKHASTYEVNAFFKNKAAAGFLLKKEILALSKIIEHPEKPFVAIMGGAKVSDKIKIIDQLLPSVNKLIIGGAMAYPFLKAAGFEVGRSLCNDEDVMLAKRLISGPSKEKLVVPVDHIVSTGLDGAPEVISGQSVPADKMALDIGPSTIELYTDILSSAKTVLWNGPMGLFENKNFSKGTFAVAQKLADLNGKAFTVIGGGDSVSAVNKAGLASKMSHVSTGGGASLEYLEQGSLPGIQALKFGIS